MKYISFEKLIICCVPLRIKQKYKCKDEIVINTLQILMITDGLEGVEDGSNDEREDENLLRNSTCSVILMNLPLNPPNPYTFSNHSINPHLTRKSSSTMMTLLQTYFPSRYKIYTPELALSSASVATTFTCVSKTHTSPSRFSLRAGHHHCKVNVFPPVLPPEKLIWLFYIFISKN